MITFLTSSPMGDLDGKYQVEGIDNRNGFADELRRYWKEGSRCLIASAFPAIRPANEEFAGALYDAFQISGFEVECVDILDDQWTDITEEQILSYDVIVLGGGHVPTQNAFFKEIGLKEKMQSFDGIVIGISAGSMNAASVVYAQPEEEGEAVDPSYERFLTGLGLTEINVLPHHQMVRDTVLDGLRLFEDITLPDSEGRMFVAIPDGSYLKVLGNVTEIYGEAYRVFPDYLAEVHEAAYKVFRDLPDFDHIGEIRVMSDRGYDW